MLEHEQDTEAVTPEAEARSSRDQADQEPEATKKPRRTTRKRASKTADASAADTGPDSTSNGAKSRAGSASANGTPPDAETDTSDAKPTRRRSRKKATATPDDAAATDAADKTTPAESAPPQAAAESSKPANVAFQPPTVLFQAPTIEPEPAAPTPAAAPAEKVDKLEKPAATRPEPAEDEDGDDEGGRRRRRRRGGRRRNKAGGDDDAKGSDGSDGDDDAGTSSDDTDDHAADDGDHDDEAAADADDGVGDDDEESGGGPGSRRRRRRRRRRGESVEASPDDPEATVVKVREPRKADEVSAVEGSTRLEAKRQRRREGREAGRRRPPILSESEFLARREAVERTMAIRQHGDRTQIAVLEDDVLVEHYVTREAQSSMIGNVYLGRVQNVLPSMEAAFVDIGRGRNAVLYAGEVDWSGLGLEGQPKRIEAALKSGQSVLVQVTKDPAGHKGARLTSQISIPGRYLVYVPQGSMNGISRKLPDTERSRLKQLLKEIVPDEAGVVVRTAAEGASEEELSRDVSRLQAQWEAIEKKAGNGQAPSLLYAEPDLLIKVVRDLFTEDFTKLVVSGDDAWDMVDGYVAHVAPHLADRLERWMSAKDAFSSFRIDEQIMKALDRKVWLPSGGSLIIERTEAMPVIDVNTGKFTGAGGNLEETVTKNNLEAAEEIVRQLRLRDIGGIIVIDFIDMVLESNRDLVLRRLVECLGRDRTKHQVAEVTSLGLVQMTRKRIGTGLLESFSEPCEACNGRGVHIRLEPVETTESTPSDSEGGRRSRRRRRGGGGGSGGPQTQESGAEQEPGDRDYGVDDEPEVPGTAEVPAEPDEAGPAEATVVETRGSTHEAADMPGAAEADMNADVTGDTEPAVAVLQAEPEPAVDSELAVSRADDETATSAEAITTEVSGDTEPGAAAAVRAEPDPAAEPLAAAEPPVAAETGTKMDSEAAVEPESASEREVEPEAAVESEPAVESEAAVVPEAQVGRETQVGTEAAPESEESVTPPESVTVPAPDQPDAVDATPASSGTLAIGAEADADLDLATATTTAPVEQGPLPDEGAATVDHGEGDRHPEDEGHHEGEPVDHHSRGWTVAAE